MRIVEAFEADQSDDVVEDLTRRAYGVRPEPPEQGTSLVSYYAAFSRLEDARMLRKEVKTLRASYTSVGAREPDPEKNPDEMLPMRSRQYAQALASAKGLIADADKSLKEGY